METIEKAAEIIKGAIFGGNSSVIGNIVAAIHLRRWIVGRHPDGIHAEVFEIVQPGDHTRQITDAIAVGQITPGPVLSSSTFVGFLAGGFWGGVASTVGVFLPSFIIVAITAPLVKKMRENAISSAFLKGVNAAVVALILMVCVNLAQNALVDVWTILILAVGFLAMMLLKAQPYVLVLAGLVGLVVWRR